MSRAPAQTAPRPAPALRTLPPTPAAPTPQTWCRGKKVWEAESLCLDCHAFSFRSYADPDFETPEQYEKRRWQELAQGETVA